MIFREATVNDIDDYMRVRMAVKENVLNTPALVTKEGEVKYLTVDGKGWICEINDKIVGFAIVGLVQRSIWALFVLPEFENFGIGKKLHYIMVSWYFKQTREPVWLTTAPNTRAELFYEKQGWQHSGMKGNEVLFVMNYDTWKSLSDDHDLAISI